jgi:starch synthase
MRVLYITSEAFPLAKTGGLADVSAALPAALRDLDLDVQLLMPGYPQALEQAPNPTRIVRLGDPLGCGETRLLETCLPQTSVPAWLIDCPDLYRRRGGLYQDADGADWPDNALRFALLDHVATGIATEPGRSWRPDVIHANDWHAGLIPYLLSRHQGARPPAVLTIHNLAYQGLFPANELARLFLPADASTVMEFYGRVSFLKAGLATADAITTVSPTYAAEIVTPEYGCGMDGLLRERRQVLCGILNGIDYQVWDPGTDPYIACNYSARSFAAKSKCKLAIQTELGLDTGINTPVMAFMSRLVHQKMPDVVLEALPGLLTRGIQFVLLGEGDSHYQERFGALADAYPGRVAVRIGYEEPLGHRLLAGADMLLHPSRFEPCGLVPIYAMRYGTVPIVRRSGGMADSVTDATPEALRQGSATGLSFAESSIVELSECVDRALALYRQPILWRRLQAAAMRQDFSWRRSAKAYAELYRSLAHAPAESVLKTRISEPEPTELEKLTA